MATTLTTLGEIYVEDQGATDEPVALLWPSLFTDHSMWRHQVSALRAAGWRTLTLDPPGHGRSAAPTRTFSMDECADVALAILDTAQVRTPVLWLGTSWGGFVGPRVALRAPDRVAGMVLFNTSAERAKPLNRAKDWLLTKLLASAPMRHAVDRLIVSALLSPETRRRQPELAVELQAHLGGWNRNGVVNAVRSVLVDRQAILDALPGIAIPTLVVSGAQDSILPTELSQRIAEKLPNSRQVEVPSAAHLVPLEALEAANKLILDFLEQMDRRQDCENCNGT